MTSMLWCNVAITPHFSWPNVRCAIPFEGNTIVLSPPTETLACRAALLDSNRTTFEKGGTILSRFLSRYAWTMNAGISELFYVGTNIPSEPGRLGQGTYARAGWATTDPPHCIYMPKPGNESGELALALYREGLSVNSIPFGFLSLFKILNILHSDGASQPKWINDHLPDIWYPPAADRVREIQAEHQDVGRYMFVQGRCAVAHANTQPLVNPDNFLDKRRLESDFPLMKEIAALFIERELGVSSNSSFYKNFDPNQHGDKMLMKGTSTDGRVKYAPYTNENYKELLGSDRG